MINAKAAGCIRQADFPVGYESVSTGYMSGFVSRERQRTTSSTSELPAAGSHSNPRALHDRDQCLSAGQGRADLRHVALHTHVVLRPVVVCVLLLDGQVGGPW